MISNSGKVVSFPDIETVEHEAGAWVARMDGQDLSAGERAALKAWLKQTPLHEEALKRMTVVWNDCDLLDDLHHIEPVILERRERFFFPRPAVWIGAAAAACFIFIVVAIVGRSGDWLIDRQSGQFTTGVGEQEKITLVDGSVIMLNTNSKIEVDIDADARRIRLERGEALFDVAPDVQRPFVVSAGNSAVRAVGTAFAVRLRDDNVEVTVSKGVVELLSEAILPKLTATADRKTPSLTSLAALTANEHAVFADKVQRLERLDEKTLERKLLWREGMIGFEGEPLSEVVAEIERYTDMKIEIADPDLQATPIGGNFPVGETDGLFEALETVFDIEVTHIDAHHVMLSCRPQK
ncbi:MAG: FecR domain-containing protein [Amphiplicatus sp.]